MKNSARHAAIGIAIATLVGGVGTGTAEASLWSFLSGAGGGQSATAPGAAGQPKPIVTAGAAAPLQDGSYTGQTFDAYYGQVQVKANIAGGKITSIDVLQYPKDRRTSRSINSQALPMLNTEVISAQTTQVDIVSGATLTSEAYLRSLKTALNTAHGGI
jgi:uncharacterized protein with FMN-binding domain